MRWTVRQVTATTLAAAAVVAAVALLGACTGSSATVSTLTPSPEPVPTRTPAISPTAVATSTPTPGVSTTAAATASPTPNVIEPTPVESIVSGLIYPIEGACLPANDNLMPNAPRVYRAGVHEGVDIYPGLACAIIGEGTPVLAAKAGVVVRADWRFEEMTAGELDELLTRSENQGYTDAAALDRFRGRQVWIDHEDGIITRYAHLGEISAGIDVGVAVQAGEVMGYVGDSGTPEAVTAPGTEMHLHFEIRLGESFLGAGLPPHQVRALLEQAFSIP